MSGTFVELRERKACSLSGREGASKADGRTEGLADEDFDRQRERARRAGNGKETRRGGERERKLDLDTAERLNGAESRISRTRVNDNRERGHFEVPLIRPETIAIQRIIALVECTA